MENYELTRELVLQLLKTRMTFRQLLQRVLKRNNIDMTFEMLQIMSRLRHEQGISQQTLAEKTAKDKACLTNLMGNMEKRGWVIRKEDPSDKRNRLVYLTAEGEMLNNTVFPLIYDLYSQIVRQLGVDEINSSINQLKRLDELFNQL